jgi:hypothetical protein
MPRPTKAFRRQKLQAIEAWQKGDKKEAYKLWGEAAKSYKEHREKKRNKKAKAAAAEQPAEKPASS